MIFDVFSTFQNKMKNFQKNQRKKLFFEKKIFDNFSPNRQIFKKIFFIETIIIIVLNK